MSDTSGAPQVDVRRAWTYDGEDEGTLHIELAGGDETLNVTLKAARNPRMFEFITKHATINVEPRPVREPKTRTD